MAEHPEFRSAVAALDRGDLEALSTLLGRFPELIDARSGPRADGESGPYSGYFWRATLLHHTAGNPIRGSLPKNIVDVARVLLDAGAEVDATCGGGPRQPDTAGSTTLSLVASGSNAWRQGVSEQLIDLLLAYGARLDPAGTGSILWTSIFHTVENQGQREVAEMLYRRGHPVDLCFAAGLGDLEVIESFFDAKGRLEANADWLYRHHRKSSAPKIGTPQEVLQDAFLFSVIANRPVVANFFLQQQRAGSIDLNAFRPWGPEVVTPLHAAAWAGWPTMTRYLLELGADPRLRDPGHQGTALSWAQHCERPAVVQVLQARAG